jgi:hypothetical protein
VQIRAGPTDADKVEGSLAHSAQAELRAAVRALRAPAGHLRAEPPRSSPFARTLAAAGYPATQRASLASLAVRAHAAETATLMPSTELAFFLVPRREEIRAALTRTAVAVAGAGVATVLMGAHVERKVAIERGQPHGVPLRDDDPLAAEWAIVAAGPKGRVAFVAREDPEAGDWEWLFTRDPIAAGRAATCLLERTPHLRLRVPALN